MEPMILVPLPMHTVFLPTCCACLLQCCVQLPRCWQNTKPASKRANKQENIFLFPSFIPEQRFAAHKNKNKRGSRKSKYMVEIDHLQTLPPPHRLLLPSQLIPANFSPSCLTHACRLQDPVADYRFFEFSFFKKIKIQKSN